MKTWMIMLGVVGLMGMFVFVFGGMCISTFNTYGSLTTTMKQKQVDNKNQFDNMWKKISQVAQVTDAQKNALMEIFYKSCKS